MGLNTRIIGVPFCQPLRAKARRLRRQTKIIANSPGRELLLPFWRAARAVHRRADHGDHGRSAQKPLGLELMPVLCVIRIVLPVGRGDHFADLFSSLTLINGQAPRSEFAVIRNPCSDFQDCLERVRVWPGAFHRFSEITAAVF